MTYAKESVRPILTIKKLRDLRACASCFLIVESDVLPSGNLSSPTHTFQKNKTTMMTFSNRFSRYSDQLLVAKMLSCCSMLLFLSLCAHAHNGAVAYAYPVDQIKIDGDLSDWAKVKTRYPIQVSLSGKKPQNAADYAGYFKVGYNLKNQSLYIALEITDENYLRDTTKNVSWNTQDGLELYVDARHLPDGSGVASYLFSKDFKHINKSAWDPATKNADWDKIEVVLTRKGDRLIYEWRIALDGYVQAGRSMGLDFQIFDHDGSDDFTISAWGKRGHKYANPRSLGDVVLLRTGETLSEVSGNIRWHPEQKMRLPEEVRLASTTSPALWIDADVDSLGYYATKLPAGNYHLSPSEEFVYRDDHLYTAAFSKPSLVIAVKAGQKTQTPTVTIKGEMAPDLIPAKGILHSNFDAAKAAEVDAFVETYRKYYRIAGVSLALIKDGQVIYHKTYGVQNSITKVPVNENTLFEAASVTKPVFAYAVMRLAERGVIDLEKPLYEYLPNEDIAYDERYKRITAHHVLSHRTGFPNWRWMNPDGKLDLKFEPGTSFGYSGEGFEYLKKVVEKITGKGVEQVLQEEVIGPLGLQHMYFSKSDTLAKLAAIGHSGNIPTTDELPEKPGMAYSMYTEAHEFTTFMLTLLNQKGLKAETYEQMLRLQSEYPMEEGEPVPKYKQYMGLSINVRDSPYGKALGHGGNNGDFTCEFEVYKDQKMGYVVFTNADSSYPFISALPDFLVDGKEGK